jgi:hypothetical protein
VATKTIYIKDEALWDKAKRVAAQEQEGVSAVIANALARYVSEVEGRRMGQETFRILVRPNSLADSVLLGFTGTTLFSETRKGSETAFQATLYRTSGRRYILTVAAPEAEAPHYYSSNESLDDLVPDSEADELGFDPRHIREWLHESKSFFEDLTVNEVWID